MAITYDFRLKYFIVLSRQEVLFVSGLKTEVTVGNCKRLQ